MMKRSLLAVAVTAITAQAAYAAPFMPMDARGLAMGNTGVASAKRAHAPAYNPSLLSQGHENDDFALLFPQFGVTAADEEELVDEAQLISDEIFPQFESVVSDAGGLSDRLDGLLLAIEGLELTLNNLGSITNQTELDQAVLDLRSSNTALSGAATSVQSGLSDVQSSTADLTKSLGNVSGNPLSARLGVAGALAIPSKKFAAAVSVSANANISGKVNFSDSDLELLNAYVPAASSYVGQAQTLSNQLTTALDTVDAATDTASAISELQNQTATLQTSASSLQGFDSAPLDALNGSSIIEDGTLSLDAENPDLSSTSQFVAVAVAEIGLSFSREFEIKGEKVAFGITPKLQKISTFHYADEVDGFEDIDEDTFKDTQKDYSKFNLDIGASYRLGESGKWMVGIVARNLLGGSFDYNDVVVTKKDDFGNSIPGSEYTIEGGTVELNPQFRAGVAYNGEWTSVAFDLDLVENDPVAFEAPTQFAAVGVELDVFSFMQLRAGYRTNLSASDASVASIGLGLSPFGVHLDIAAMANPSKPEKEAGIALETGFYF